MITTLDNYFTQNNYNTNPKKQICLKNGWDELPPKEIAALIRQDLKKEFGKKIKFSIRSKRYPREVVAEIKAISKDLLLSREDFKEKIICSHHFDDERVPEYLEEYDKGHFTKIHLKDETYDTIFLFLNKYNYDNSDPMTDYFECNYYEFLQMSSSCEIL